MTVPPIWKVVALPPDELDELEEPEELEELDELEELELDELEELDAGVEELPPPQAATTALASSENKTRRVVPSDGRLVFKMRVI